MAAQWLSDLVEVEMMEMEENELQGDGFDHSSSGQQKRVAFGLNQHHHQLHQYPIHLSGTKTAAPLFNCKKPRTTATGWDNDVKDRSAAASTILSFGAEVPKSDQEHAMFYGGVHVQPKMEVEIAFPGIIGKVGGSDKRMYDAMRKGGGHDMPSLYSQSKREREEHILAERKRREILSQRFIALSKIVPGLKKMDKASVLEDAVKYLKYLQHKVQHLEAQAAKQTVESAAIVKKIHVASDECDDAENHSSCNENVISKRINVLRSLPEIEAKMTEQTVIIKIHCENHKGALVKVLSEIEALGVSITSTNVMPFAGLSLDITAVAQIEEDSIILNVKDVVKKLNQAFKRIFT